VIGLQGSVPFAGNWAFDYLGDAAILFGTQNLVTTTSTAISFSTGVGSGSLTTSDAQRFASVFSGDIQMGASYWINPNLKVGASYRLDALIDLQNWNGPAVATITPTRYTHGLRLTVIGQF
jgi:hypothetical protein